jgi:hypothetical protein
MYFFSTITLLVTSFLYSTTTAVPLDLNTPLITRGQNGKCSIDWTLTEFLPRPSDGRRSTISADLFDGYAPIDRNTRPRMQNMKWLGSEGLPGASTNDAVELNEHAVFIHDINGDNIMMIMWKMSPGNPTPSPKLLSLIPMLIMLQTTPTIQSGWTFTTVHRPRTS